MNPTASNLLPPLAALLAAALDLAPAGAQIDPYDQLYLTIEQAEHGSVLAGGEFAAAGACELGGHAFAARYSAAGAEIWRRHAGGDEPLVCNAGAGCDLFAGFESFDPAFIAASRVESLTADPESGLVTATGTLHLAWTEGTCTAGVGTARGDFALLLAPDGTPLGDTYAGPDPRGVPLRPLCPTTCPEALARALQPPEGAEAAPGSGDTSAMAVSLPAGVATSVRIDAGDPAGGSVQDLRVSDDQRFAVRPLERSHEPDLTEIAVGLRLAPGSLCLEIQVSGPSTLAVDFELPGLAGPVAFGAATLYPGADNTVVFPMELLTAALGDPPGSPLPDGPAEVALSILTFPGAPVAGARVITANAEDPRTSTDLVKIQIKPF